MNWRKNHMAVFRMENTQASVEVSEHASEITSFFDKETGIEHMWPGNPDFWAGRNPTLFPMVGSTWNKEVVIDGTVYHMGNHGFTRGSDFTCVRHDENTIVMELKDSEATLAQYPFAFTLRITYTLNGKQLDIHYSITNDNDRVMPFNFGLHPAFNCPMAEGETQAEYHLELNAPETFTTLQGKKLSEGNVLELNRADLEQTILVTAPKTTETKLTNGKHTVTVRTEGYEWLAFWSAKNNAPFVCIEPWHSHSDFEEVKVPFEKREGTLFLDAHQEFTTDYSIIVG